MSGINKKMIRQFLTPPRIGRRFQIDNKTWEVVEVIRKVSNVDYRYEVKAELIKC